MVAGMSPEDKRPSIHDLAGRVSDWCGVVFIAWSGMTAIIGWLASHSPPLSQYGWEGVVIFALLTSSLMVGLLGLGLLGWRYFRPLTPLTAAAAGIDEPTSIQTAHTTLPKRSLLAMSGIAVISFAGLGLNFWVRRAEAPVQKISSEKDVFEREVVSIPMLIADGPPTIAGKSFRKCVIRGPGYLKLQDRVTMLFCDVQTERAIVNVPEGGAAIGAIFLINDKFEQCYFDGITFIGTPEDTKSLSNALSIQTLADWKTTVGWS